MSLNLSVKNVPLDWAERLRARAERNHRSLQGELMAIIETALSEADAVPRATTAGSRANPGLTRGTKSIEQIAAEHRVLYPEPFHDLPRAVDLLRADRDAR